MCDNVNIAYEELLNRVSSCMLTMKNNGIEERFPISLIDINCWEWPQGVGIYGLYKYYETSGRQDILDFLIHWYDERMEEGILEKNVNTTAPMLTLTYIYEITRKEEYLDLIREWTAWIMDGSLIRTGDGCFQHMITGDPNQSEILIDTMFMTVLFLARAGVILGRKDCVDEANYQFLQHIKYLLNKKEGLFYHGFNFDRNNNYGEIMWGRGNSWYTVAIMDYLEMVEIDEGLKRHFLTVYYDQVNALKKYADRDCGLWHTIINDNSSYIEISASAGFLCGILHGIRTGHLDINEYGDMVDKALAHLPEYIKEDGTVMNVSYGTPIGENADFYKEIICCPMTYGQAMTIMALQEAMVYTGKGKAV